jgi:transposase
MTVPRVEVITSVERRRRWSGAEKERLVAASFEPGVTASEVARSAGIHVSRLFQWRRDLCERVDVGATPLVPVEIIPAGAALDMEPPPSSPSVGGKRRGGIIEIELGGKRRVRVDRDFDDEALRRALDALGSR